MERKVTRFLTLLAASLVAYHVVFFAIPFGKSAAFWISYGFGACTLIAAFALWYLAYVKKNEWDEPCSTSAVAKLAARYGAAQILLSIVGASLESYLPWWAALVVFVLLGAVAVAAGATAAAEAEKRPEREERRQEQTEAILRLQKKIGVLIAQCEEETAAKALSELREQLRYADPVSSAATEELEADLMAVAEEMEMGLAEADWAIIQSLCRRFSGILAARNDCCRESKG